jgi:hypothetical protein
MASEAEWARDALGRGIPELGTDKALPAGGFPVVVSGMPPPLPQGYLRRHGVVPAAGAKAPAAALPVGPLRRPERPGQSAGYTIGLVLPLRSWSCRSSR